MKFNREDEIKELIEKITDILNIMYQLDIPNKYIQFLTSLEKYLEIEYIQEISGTKFNSNPYSFVLNSPIDYWDILGLQTGSDARPAAEGENLGGRREYENQNKSAFDFINPLRVEEFTTCVELLFSIQSLPDRK